ALAAVAACARCLDAPRALAEGSPSRPSPEPAMSLLRTLLLCSLFALAGCASAAPKYWVELAGERYEVELAQDDESRARGLMFRNSMPVNHGMLFIHDRQEPQSYWMKNTRLALDILYFDNQRRLVSQKRDVPP